MKSNHYSFFKGAGVGVLKPKQYARLSKWGKLQKSNHLYNVEHVVQSTFQKLLITQQLLLCVLK